MAGLAVLDVVIGLVFVYAILSLVTSSLTELVGGWLNLRGKNLRDAIRGMLDGTGGDDALTKKFFDHPLIAAMMQGKKLPSYLPADKFAQVTIALLDESSGAPESLVDLRKALDGSPNQHLAKALGAVSAKAEATIEDVQKQLEAWFDQTMARASGWFQRRITWFLLVFGFLASVAVNADTLQIIETLYTDGAIREAIVARAEQAVATPPVVEDSPRKLVEDNIQPIVGWSKHDEDVLVGKSASASAWALKLIGLVLTGIAVSLGAPFWFQLLGKLVSLRTTVREPLAAEKKAQKRDKEAGKDAKAD